MRSGSAKQLLNLANGETWVVVGSHAEAIIYRDGRDRKFHFVERLKNSGHPTDEPPASGNTSSARKFASSIAAFLDHARRDDRYGHLILAAEPHFLGLLRGALSTPVRGSISHEIPREYVDGSDDEIRARFLTAIAAREK